MEPIEQVLGRTRTITFDCYGTLIDWRAGVESALQQIFGTAIIHRMHQVFDAYVRAEAEIEAETYQTYRQVLAAVVRGLASDFNVGISGERAGMLAELLPTWTPFKDSDEALGRLKQRFRLGVLSNIDRDLFARTAAHFETKFDFVITAEDVGSYKPGLKHFERLLESHAERDTVLHVAQSLYHDGVPAGKLDLAYVWINRYNEVNETEVRPLAVYPDLKSLADAACC
jgi:2-haloacid dehalogenase